jgi:hypothetical protein
LGRWSAVEGSWTGVWFGLLSFHLAAIACRALFHCCKVFCGGSREVPVVDTEVLLSSLWICTGKFAELRNELGVVLIVCHLGGWCLFGDGGVILYAQSLLELGKNTMEFLGSRRWK